MGVLSRILGFPDGTSAKQFVCQRRRRRDKEDLQQKEMATYSSILAGKSHAQRSLAGTVHGATKSQTQLPCYITLYEKNGGIITPGLLCWVV